MLKVIFYLYFFIFLSISESSNESYSKYWLISCSQSDCSFAFGSCLNCFGEQDCKTCITLSKPECSLCADDIFNDDDMESVNGNKYLICDSFDPIQQKACQIYCRGKYQKSGQCVRENNFPICKCSAEPGTWTTDLSVSTQMTEQQLSSTIFQPTTATNVPNTMFNGTIKLNITISSYQKILPLPNGDLVRGSFGNIIEIWDMQKGVVKRNLSSTFSRPSSLELLSNGDLVASYWSEKTLLIFDLNLANGEALKNTIQTNDSFLCLTVLKNDDLAIGENGNNYDIVIRNYRNGIVKTRLSGHKLSVFQIVELPDGNLVSCSSDKTIKVWNLTTGTILKSISHSDFVYSIGLSKNGYLISGLYKSGLIYVWDLETNSLIRKLIGHSDSICSNRCLQFLSNGHLLSASFDKTLKVWNPNEDTVIYTSSPHKSRVYQLAVLPNGSIISSSDKEIIVWD